ncbi:MAG TPA: hypothetical protein VMU80_09060 [Bryobacteraceae bacterium]|nr:hypothetical protein [Bryobacteraceae bacterium]
MQFTLTGFRQDQGDRVFEFERVTEDRARTAFTVHADLALARRYGIPMQELPLLCISLLERSAANAETHDLTFTEEDMRTCANERAAAKEEAAKRRKTPRRAAAASFGAAWRTPQL